MRLTPSRGAVSDGCYHNVSNYLKKAVNAFLSNINILINVGPSQSLISKKISRGVSQKLVLGPFWWNRGFDIVLGSALPEGIEVCYADNTLLVATGKKWSRTLRLMETVIAAVTKSINKVGLKVSFEKTNAVWFSPDNLRLHGYEWMINAFEYRTT